MATSAWFDYNAYMANKLAQLVKAEPDANWDMTKLVQVFAEAGFAGAEGAEKHFEQFGQLEDVAPNAFFNATEYYRAKAAQLYEKAPKDVTDLDVAAVKLALKDAGLSAWGHYEQYGNAEGVNPSNSFDTEAYMNAKLVALNAVKDGKQWTMDELNAAFKDAGLSALEHFMMFGGSGDGEVAQKYEGKVPAVFAVPEDKKVTPDAGNVGKTYTLTTGIDDFTGTAANDTFVAGQSSSIATLNAGDTLNGGAGTDTLKIYNGGGAADFANADITGIEVVQVIGSTQASSSTINVSGNADVEELWFVGGTMGTATLAVDQKLGFSGTVTAGTVTYVDVAGTDDSATLAFDKATVGGFTVASIENLTLEFAGANSIGAITAASAATLVVTGNGEASVAVTDATALKSVDTTGFAGDLTLSLTGATAVTGFAYKGGAGNETLTFDTAAAVVKYTIDLGAGDDSLSLSGTTFATEAKIDGGDGYDTLVIDRAYTADDFKHFSNFEALKITKTLNQDASLFAGDILVSGTAATLTNLGDTQDVFLSGTNTITVAYTGTGAQNHTVNLTFDTESATNTAVTLSNLVDGSSSVKTLNITSEGTDHGIATKATVGKANVITSLAGADGLMAVNIDGTSDLSFTTNALENDLSVNAGTFTGNLIFDGILATKKLSVTGGSGNDHITGSSLADHLVGGDGNDTLVAGTGSGAGGDTLAGGKGIDAFDVAGITAGGTAFADISAAMVTIEDFEKGETITVNTTTAAKIEKYAGLVNDLQTAVETIAKGNVVSVKWFTFEGNTYIVNNADTSATMIATDQIVKLVGELDLSGATFDASTLTW